MMSAANSPTMPEIIERRGVERTYQELSAVYQTADGAEIPCKFLDFSLMGARVSFDDASGIPDQLTLVVPDVGLRYDAEVRWRKDNDIGVLFNKAERI